MKKNKLLLAISILVICVCSCKKENSFYVQETTQVVSQPKLVKNIAAPDGVLSFDNKRSLEAFLKDLEYDKAPSDRKLPSGFRSLHDFFQDYRDKIALQSTLSNKVQSNYQSLTENYLPIESTQEEYIYNLDSYLVPDDRFSYVLNDDLQIMVDGEFYQITRLGTLVVEAQKLAGFAQWYPTQENDVLYNPTLTDFPNQMPLGNNTYSVGEGITLQAINTFDDGSGNNDFGLGLGGGFFVQPYGTGSGSGSTITQTVEVMDTYTVDSLFNRSENIRRGDRRFVFEAYNNNFLGLNVFRSIGVKGKVQRERRFLWITYWGESFGDEIIVGCENMDLRLDYTFPIPQQYTLLERPKFNGIIPAYQVGNHAFDVIDLDINLSASFYGRTYNLQSQNFINLINSQFNTLVGSQVNNFFTPIQNDIINSFDPSFKSRYAAYTKKINALTENNKYRISLGATEKKQGNSHINNWKMDYNGGLTVKIGNSTSVSGNAYGYSMKAGNFYGKARIGSDWYKIRILRK